MQIENCEISDIIYDSRKAKKGTAFVCLCGAKSDGHLYAKSAYDKGVRLFFAQRKLDLPDDAYVIICNDTRIKLAELSRELFSYPDKKLRIIGITGTKGKTTTANIISQIINESGQNAATIGTNGITINGVTVPTLNTTPESYELYRAFSDMVKNGVSYCVMEVSSQAVKLNRIYGIEFDIGVFTNLSRDHIGEGEHADYTEYMTCKSGLFERSKLSILNSDDKAFDFMRAHAKGDIITYSQKGGDYCASNIRKWSSRTHLGIEFECLSGTSVHTVRVSTPGLYSVYNALCAFAVCDALGIEKSLISSSLAKVRVKGRFEIIDALKYATFIIDYAHNGLSLESVLKTIKDYSPKRLVVLFGSVGERTRGRRRELAEAASKYADFVIVTSDNPGTENPDKIVDEIASHLSPKMNYVKITDRKDAIFYAVKNAEVGDVILLAGKGHEDYQLIGTQKVPFSEKQIIRDACNILYKTARI